MSPSANRDRLDEPAVGEEEMHNGQYRAAQSVHPDDGSDFVECTRP